jgi:hypothetical protein
MQSVPHFKQIMRRRRRVLGASWTPDSVTASGYSPDHWYRSDGPLWQDAGLTAAIADGDDVGRWEDKTANVDHVNQAVALDKPHLETGDTLNGHQVLRFDGTNHYLQGAFTNGGAILTPHVMFAVAKLDAGLANDNGTYFLTCEDDAVKLVLYKQGGTIPDRWEIYDGAALGKAGGTANSNWNIWCALFNGASSEFWLNGISEASGNAGSAVHSGLTIGANNAGNSPWNGDIAEIILYDAALPDADKNQVGTYLARRYGLSWAGIA